MVCGNMNNFTGLFQIQKWALGQEAADAAVGGSGKVVVNEHFWGIG